MVKARNSYLIRVEHCCGVRPCTTTGATTGGVGAAVVATVEAASAPAVEVAGVVVVVVVEAAAAVELGPAVFPSQASMTGRQLPVSWLI